jgi:16S rRNA (cytosine967-C5)-methyltransferase
MSSAARDFALITLDSRRLPHWPEMQLRAAREPGPPPPSDPRDRALAEQITVGVVKNLLHLQFLIRQYADRPLSRIDALAQKILAIGLYQLRFLTRIPASAAVDEAVEQSRRFGRQRATGFINAVLRNATRLPDVPLPDRQEDPARFAEVVLSHPREVFGRLTALIGVSDALRFCEHDNREAPTIVRLYQSASPADLVASDVTATPHEQSNMFVVSPAKPSVLADWARRAVAQVQDPTATRAVEHLHIEPGQTVLDRCSGLGTKTLQMHERVGTHGLVVAVDPSAPRMQILRRMVEQRAITNVLVREIGMLTELEPDDPNTFDRILIDAPCSNSGVLARRPEARYHQSDRALSSLAKLQDRILDDTAPALRPGGRLVYSTCSVWPEENGERVQAFLRRHGDYSLVQEEAVLPAFSDDPTRYHDGGYFAVMARGADGEAVPSR